MFAKPYKLKSNNALKNSEKKHLAQRVQDEFPFATEEMVKEIVPLKGNCTCLKLVLHSGESVSVFAADGSPMLVETAAGLVPTVCALWRAPALVPMLTIHTPVLQKVQNGAPLYLPGVSLPAQGAGFPQFPCGAVLGARTEDNASACLVGRAAMGSGDMLLRASGVCLDTLHVYGDALCREPKFGTLQRPARPPPPAPDTVLTLSGNVQQLTLQPVKEEWPSLGRQPPRPAPAPAPAVNEPRLIPDAPPPAPAPEEQEGDETMLTDSAADGVPSDMDELLKWSLLGFLKLEGKSAELPLKTNLLYKNYLCELCPPERPLDVKKSSYKKLSKFLEAMQQEGLIEVRELEKGVASLVAVNCAHPLVRTHAAPARPRAERERTRDYTPPLVTECYCITAHVQELFQPLKKGTAVTSAAVRAALTQYVKGRGLDAHARGAVTLDSLLAKIMNRPEQEATKWEALQAGVLARMTPATEMRFADGSVRLSKARLTPVRMDVAVRSGNKKVTLVSNLESFGFNLAALAHVCQTGVAATCGVTRTPAASADQLMLQGDQTYYVAKLLTEKYELPKKYIEGADKALKKKQK